MVISSQLPAIKSDLLAAGFELEEFPHSLNARMSGSDLRIQLTLDPRYQKFVDGAHVFEVLNQRVPVASLQNVVQGKIWAWSDASGRASKRKKDELDLMRILETSPETRSRMPDEIKVLVPE